MEPKKTPAAERFAAIAQDLNERQRVYLLTVHDEDQRREDVNRRPGGAMAATWRWILYGAVGARALDAGWTLRAQLEKLDLVSEGTGSTWASLEARGLVMTKRVHTGLMDARTLKSILSLMIRMTVDGRKVARLLRGQPSTRPKVEKPLSLSALRLIAHGQKNPDVEFDWSAPWPGGYGPDFLVVRAVVKGLITRGLLEGEAPHRLKITPAGRALDVTAEPNWKPMREWTEIPL
jgi:hypothetical protein